MDHTDVTRVEDPTQAILSRSSLYSKYLQDWVVNVASGCSHGCRFCYVPATPNIRTRQEMLQEHAGVEDAQGEWGEYVLYRDGLGDRLDEHLDRKRTWKRTRGGQGIVGLCYSTDPYMDPRAGEISTRCVEALADHGRYARVQTRNPLLASNYLEAFQDAGEFVTIGSSINSLDESAVQALEPRAPSPEARVQGLKRFSDAGVPVFVSMSPTFPTMDRADIRDLMERIADLEPDVVFHEPINPRGANFEMTVAAAEEAGEEELAHELVDVQHPEAWVEYAIQHFRWVQEAADDFEVAVNLWPDDDLLRHVPDGSDRERWLTQWRFRQSPENFAGRPDPRDSMPELPDRRTTLSDLS
jgi:DNA repair photolyase